MKFCTSVYLDNLWKAIEYQGRRSNVKVTRFLCAWYCLNQLAWIYQMLRRPLIPCRSLLNMQTLGQRSHTPGSKMWCLSLIQHWATRGQYLALTKAWWSCFVYFLSVNARVIRQQSWLLVTGLESSTLPCWVMVALFLLLVCFGFNSYMHGMSSGWPHNDYCIVIWINFINYIVKFCIIFWLVCYIWQWMAAQCAAVSK